MGNVGYRFQGKEVPASPGDVWQPPLSPRVGEMVIPAGEASYVQPWEVQHGQIIHMYNPWEAGLGGKKAFRGVKAYHGPGSNCGLAGERWEARGRVMELGAEN